MRMLLIVIFLAILFGGPAVYFTETNSGPAKLFIQLQSAFLGVYFPVSTMVLIILFELLIVMIPLLILAILIKRLTGKTVIEHIKKT